jgi:lipocalin
MDVDNKLNTLNHLPFQMEYQCFLLEPNNKVALVGNPVLNPKIWILFKQYISKN